MMCEQCGEDVHPYQEMQIDGSMVSRCPTAGCANTLFVQQADAVPKVSPAAKAAAPAAKQTQRFDEDAPLTARAIVAYAQHRLDEVRHQLDTMQELQREVQLLERIVGAAAAATDEH